MSLVSFYSRVLPCLTMLEALGAALMMQQLLCIPMPTLPAMMEVPDRLCWRASLSMVCVCTGKDIVRFHAVMWPALLMSAGLPPPQQVFGHGFLTKDGLKMGKALGNVLDPFALAATYGADAVRFYFLKEIRFGQVIPPSVPCALQHAAKRML